MHSLKLRPALVITGALGFALSCAPREVSVAAEKGGACDYGATPESEEARVCASGYSCEPVQGGGDAYVCAVPVIIRGQVFDALTGDAVEGALITALDRTSAPVSDVAVSDGSGAYELEVVALRDSDGELADDAIYTLQVFAADYAPFPFGVRPALPISAADGVTETVPGEDADGDGDPDDEELLVIDTPTTEVALIPLADAGGGTIHGSIGGDEGPVPAGTLVIAEGAGTPAPYGLADRSGEFTIFNVPPGPVTVSGYRSGIEVTPASVDVAAGTTHEVELLVAARGDALASVSGSASIVNAPGGSETSVVLVPSSVFNEPLERGPVPFGLRAPDPGIDANVSGAFTITQVPAGTYKVLAAFENDDLVRDPDISIAGTQIQEITVASGQSVEVPENFKVTEALAVVRPGAEEPEGVSGTPTFEFADDSSEDRYIVVVYDALGDLIWEKTDVPGVSGSETVEVEYGGPALIPGMWYQFWATSVRDKQGETRISRTEDLRGVFYAE